MKQEFMEYINFYILFFHKDNIPFFSADKVSLQSWSVTVNKPRIIDIYPRISLMIQYIRQMHLKKQNNFTLSGLSSTSAFKRPKDKENFPAQLHKTERKSSLGARIPLSDLPANNFDFTCNEKTQKCQAPRQSSIEVTKISRNMDSSVFAGSRWLDSQKEMMEFIINLKSKKSEPRYKSSRGKKTTECFQLQDKQLDQREMLCNRMLVMKKIQKHEKEAISSFYDKDYNKCFNELQKAESLIKKEQVNTPEHQLYINYLYAEFYFKLEINDQWKIYMQRAKLCSNKVNTEESSQMKQYVMNVKALDICFHLHQQKYDKVLTLINQLREEEFLSSKIRRRINNTEITTLKKLHRYQDAINSIDEESHAVETDPELSNEKKESQFAKLFEQKIEITSEYLSIEEAMKMVEYLLNFQEVSAGNKDNFTHYNLKIYAIYAQFLKQDNDKLKLLFFYEKWLEIEPSKKEKLKIQLQLFSIYYQMGIYQKALELFDSISSQNVVYLGPEYLVMFANIKHFQGDEKEAIGIITKSIDICQEESEKALYMYRLLELDLEAEGVSRCEREQMLEEFIRKGEKQNVEHIAELYMEYLSDKNQKEKLYHFSSKWKQTACFSDHRSGRKASSKK